MLFNLIETICNKLLFALFDYIVCDFLKQRKNI